MQEFMHAFDYTNKPDFATAVTGSLAGVRMEFEMEFDLKIASHCNPGAWKSMIIFIHQLHQINIKVI